MKLKPHQIRALARPLTFFLRTVVRTWRVRDEGFVTERPDSEFIDVLQHGEMLLIVPVFLAHPPIIMASEHRDGALIAEVLERLGGTVVRGSSTRGGAKAYLQMLRSQDERSWMLTPDGPRGPRGSVHQGAIKLAADSGRAIRPHGFAVTSAIRLRSWDRFTIPLPFARVQHHVGEPLEIPADTDRDGRVAFARELEHRMAEAGRQAEIALGSWSDPARRDRLRGRVAAP